MFSPRVSSNRTPSSPFTPSRKGTPGKRGFSTPSRAGRDRRSQLQASSRSLQVSQIIDDSSRHRVDSFGVPLPVLITEALTLADRTTEVTVKIDPSGWAWLVGGRKLFVWRYKPTSTRGIQCKELTLPPSDLAHSAARVCVLAASTEGHPTACVAASPEGVVRYWPNIAYEASTSEISAELKGEECACVVNFQPYGCLLATTTSSLLLLKLAHGQNSITCTALKTSQGMFSGISRRMSSFIFGASPAQTAGAPLQALVAEDEDDQGSRPFYVLSDTHLQKWLVSSFSPEKLIYQVDALRLFKDAMARRVWEQESVNLPRLHVWLLDVQLIGNRVMVLGAGMNLEASQELYYAVALLSTDEEQGPSQLDSLTLLAHTERYDASREEELLRYHLLVPSQKSQEALIYNQRLIFMVPVDDSQPADRVDLQNSADQLIGAGVCDGKAVFFSSVHGMFCIVQNRHCTDDSIMEEVGQDSLLRSEMSTMGFNMSQVAELSQCDDKLSRLKACFISSLSGNQTDVVRMLEDLFPASVMEASVGEGCREIDRLVTELSRDLVDDYPSADPRWAESSRYDGGSGSSLIIVQQLRDKVRAHDYFRSFLKKFHLWEQLTSAPARDSEMCTQLLLCEHVEKLEAAISLREQEAEPMKIVDVCIKRLLKQRGAGPHPPNLNPEDIFFREVSKVHAIAPAFLEYEMEQLSSGLTSRQSSHLIIAINRLLQTMVSAALIYRQTKADNYQLPEERTQPLPEYVPWTATSGPNGLRTILSTQMTLTVERGISGTQDMETRGTMFQQLMGLADLQLDCYSSQLESLRTQQHLSERYVQLKKKYEDERRKLIEPLLEYEQFDRAASLAEKYFDFDILITVCDLTDNQERLQRYITQFSNQGFSQHLFNWYLKEGKRGRLLSQPFTQNPELGRFLANDNTRYLSWLHEIGSGDFSRLSDPNKVMFTCTQLEVFGSPQDYAAHWECWNLEAHQTLVELARTEQTFLAKRKTLLSLSKLAAMASDDPPDSVELNIGAINEELDQIDLQETLPKETLQKVGLDPDNMRVLTPHELIKLYAGDENLTATEIDYKKALDLLSYVDQAECPDDYDELKLFIWCQAILRDKESWVDTSQNEPERIRDETLFFRTVDLIFNEGDDLGMLLPSTETLLASEFLGDLRHNTHFQFLLKAGYEIISNILLSS